MRLPGCFTSALHRDQSPRLLPKAERNRKRIDVDLIPPKAFFSNPVKFPVVKTTQRHGELIRYPATECARLREPWMVSLAGAVGHIPRMAERL